MGIRFSISQKAITHLIQSSGRPSLKVANCSEYLEPQAGLSGSIRNSKLIHEKLLLDPLRLVCFSPINLVHLLHLGNKRNGGGSCVKKEAKQQRIWKTYSWPLSGLKFFNKSVITVVYVASLIAIYCCHLFYTNFLNWILYVKQGCNMIQIFETLSCLSNRDFNKIQNI
jgi:hypothetical protein